MPATQVAFFGAALAATHICFCVLAPLAHFWAFSLLEQRGNAFSWRTVLLFPHFEGYRRRCCVARLQSRLAVDPHSIAAAATQPFVGEAAPFLFESNRVVCGHGGLGPRFHDRLCRILWQTPTTKKD